MGLNNRGLRTLRDELLLQAASSQKNLEDLTCVEILKIAFTNKKKKIDEESLRKKDKEIKISLKEELMLRILIDDREVSNCYMQDVDLRRIMNKDPLDLTQTEKTLAKCYRARPDATDLNLSNEMIQYLKNKDIKILKDELIISLLESDNEMYSFDYLDMMKKILLHNLERFEVDEYTNRELKELMLLNVIRGKISWKNM